MNQNTRLLNASLFAVCILALRGPLSSSDLIYALLHQHLAQPLAG